MDRRNQLIQFAKEDPNDPFNLYALALEYLKSEPDQAVELFNQLVKSHAEYLPTYYPYAHLLIERKEVEKAEEIFKRGIEIALSRKEAKTLKELRGAYADWLYERE